MTEANKERGRFFGWNYDFIMNKSSGFHDIHNSSFTPWPYCDCAMPGNENQNLSIVCSMLTGYKLNCFVLCFVVVAVLIICLFFCWGVDDKLSEEKKTTYRVIELNETPAFSPWL